VDAHIDEAVTAGTNRASAPTGNEHEMTSRDSVRIAAYDHVARSGLHQDEDVDLVVAVFVDRRARAEPHEVRVEFAAVRQAPYRAINIARGYRTEINEHGIVAQRHSFSRLQ
jgi:hypothetical protein